MLKFGLVNLVSSLPFCLLWAPVSELACIRVLLTCFLLMSWKQRGRKWYPCFTDEVSNNFPSSRLGKGDGGGVVSPDHKVGKHCVSWEFQLEWKNKLEIVWLGLSKRLGVVFYFVLWFLLRARKVSWVRAQRRGCKMFKKRVWILWPEDPEQHSQHNHHSPLREVVLKLTCITIPGRLVRT